MKDEDYNKFFNCIYAQKSDKNINSLCKKNVVVVNKWEK